MRLLLSEPAGQRRDSIFERYTITGLISERHRLVTTDKGCHMASDDATLSWFSVRCVFKDLENELYEERITLWKAKDFASAVALAEGEAREYAEAVGGLAYLDFAQAYQLAEEPAHGSEVFSLVRESSLEREKYLDTFFDTGC